MDAAISPLAAGEFGNVTANVINGPDIKAENAEANPNRVGVKATAANEAGKSLNYTFEPHSVTALVGAVT